MLAAVAASTIGDDGRWAVVVTLVWVLVGGGHSGFGLGGGKR